jgi:soluble lytic murein transglycosylase
VIASLVLFASLAAPVHAYPVKGIVESFEPIVNHWSDAFLVPRWFTMATARAESDFRPALITHKGHRVTSRGLFQINPRNEREHARNAGLTVFRWDDPSDSTRVGIAFLARLMARYGGSLMLASAAYNAGSRRIESAKPLPQETMQYLGRIFR